MSLRLTTAAAAAVTLSIASAASATEASFSFCMDPAVLSGGESISISFNTLSGTLTGFFIEIDYDPLQSSFSWASDGSFVLSNGDQWGGYDVLFGTNFVDDWNFAGSGSASAGTYFDFRTDVPGLVYTEGETYTFTFGNGWSDSGDVSYAVCVTLFGVVPAPGGLALLGMAGLAGTRRRRS